MGKKKKKCRRSSRNRQGRSHKAKTKSKDENGWFYVVMAYLWKSSGTIFRIVVSMLVIYGICLVFPRLMQFSTSHSVSKQVRHGQKLTESSGCELLRENIGKFSKDPAKRMKDIKNMEVLLRKRGSMWGKKLSVRLLDSGKKGVGVFAEETITKGSNYFGMPLDLLITQKTIAQDPEIGAALQKEFVEPSLKLMMFTFYHAKVLKDKSPYHWYFQSCPSSYLNLPFVKMMSEGVVGCEESTCALLLVESTNFTGYGLSTMMKHEVGKKQKDLHLLTKFLNENSILKKKVGSLTINVILEMIWAMGLVVSRSYDVGDFGLSLFPYIDLINTHVSTLPGWKEKSTHDNEKSFCKAKNEKNEVLMKPGTFSLKESEYGSSNPNDVLWVRAYKDFKKGEEITIHYSDWMGNEDSFLNYGIVFPDTPNRRVAVYSYPTANLTAEEIQKGQYLTTLYMDVDSLCGATPKQVREEKMMKMFQDAAKSLMEGNDGVLEEERRKYWFKEQERNGFACTELAYQLFSFQRGVLKDILSLFEDKRKVVK